MRPVAADVDQVGEERLHTCRINHHVIMSVVGVDFAWITSLMPSVCNQVIPNLLFISSSVRREDFNRLAQVLGFLSDRTCINFRFG